MNLDLHSGWNIESLVRSPVKNWIHLPLEEFDPDVMALKCNDENVDKCPLECGLPIACPFGKVCTSVTAEDWKKLVKTSSGTPQIALSRFFKAPKDFFA